MRDWDQLEAAAAGTVEQLGGIDVVLANAGIAPAGTFESLAREQWEATIDVNLSGVYRTLHVTLPHVKERRGYILPDRLARSCAPRPMLTHYCAAKAGVEALGNGFVRSSPTPARRLAWPTSRSSTPTWSGRAVRAGRGS